MKLVILLFALVAAVAAAPAPQQLPASYVQALQQHALAELRVKQAAEQIAATGSAVVVIPGGGVGHSGLVGPSGNIGPSGMCGPSGCVQFSR